MVLHNPNNNNKSNDNSQFVDTIANNIHLARVNEVFGLGFVQQTKRSTIYVWSSNTKHIHIGRIIAWNRTNYVRTFVVVSVITMCASGGVLVMIIMLNGNMMCHLWNKSYKRKGAYPHETCVWQILSSGIVRSV